MDAIVYELNLIRQVLETAVAVLVVGIGVSWVLSAVWLVRK